MQAWLYDISERVISLMAALDEAEDKSIEPDIKAALAGLYESDIPAAVADGIRYIKRQEGQVAEIDAEIKRLKALKEARENRLARVKRGYTEFLIATGAKKIETASGNMAVSAPTYATEIDSIDDLPDEYKRTTIKVEPDKTAIKQAIQSGHKVPGAHLEARQSIRIK